MTSGAIIDLYIHTTASDGRSTPEVLVQQVQSVGIGTLAVTDHDTVAGVGHAARLAEAHGLRFVPGIEITAVHKGRDVHMLGYFVDYEACATNRAAQCRPVRRDRTSMPSLRRRALSV